MQLYYTAVLGALGGLLGWWIVGSFETTAWAIVPAYLFTGAGLGAAIGGCVAVTDGAIIKRSARRGWRDGIAGALAGALAGMLGLLLAWQAFLLLGGGFAGRAAGWMLLGGAIGLSDMLVTRRLNRAIYGMLGGLAGGLVGGFLYEALTQAFRSQSDQAQVVVGGVGLIAVGACIGALIPFARQVLSRGELRVLSGEQSGMVREISDTVSIGRYDGCDLYLPDAGVEWRHALIRRTAQGFVFELPRQGSTSAIVGERRIAPGEQALLQNGERIWVGEAQIEFVGR